MLRFLLILLLVNAIKCFADIQKEDTLNSFEYTSRFFEKLKSNYGSDNLNQHALAKLNKIIAKHVKDMSEKIVTRHKRELSEYFDKGIDTLHGFEDFKKLDFYDAQEVNIFSFRDGHETLRFAALLDASKLSLFQINNDALSYIAAYPLSNGTRLIVNNRPNGTLLIIQDQNDSIRILRFTKVRHNYYLQPVQDFESNDVTHLTTWNGMNELYLSIASHSNISIFTWFGDYFDLVQVIEIGTKKLTPFQSKGFMYLAVSGPTTWIFKYLLKSNKFKVIQKLPSSRDVSFFQLNEGHFTENFLNLATESSTVIYKNVYNRFVSFQRLPSGKYTMQIVSKKAILFFAVHEDTVDIYQYNGWTFVELNVKLYGIRKFQKVALDGKELLLVQYKNGTWALKHPLWVRKKTYKDLQEEIREWNIEAKNAARKTFKEITASNNPIRITKGYIKRLLVSNVNEHNSEALRNVSKQYDKMNSMFQEKATLINDKRQPSNLNVAFLRGKKMRLKCNTSCSIGKLNVKDTDLLSKIKMQNEKNNTISYEVLTAKEIRNWKCPILSLTVDNIVVNKSIDGTSLANLQKNTLKVSGNQTVLGKHSFANLNVTNASLPLKIGSHFLKQEIHAKKVRVKELTLTEGDVLLPLNGSVTTIAGSIKASKVTAKDAIKLRGKVTGKRLRNLSPIMYIPEPMIIHHDLILEDAKIEHLQLTDLVISKIGSLKHIFSNAVSLNDNIPVSLVFSSKKTKWSNVNLHGPRNWITTNSLNIVSGKKRILHNVAVTRFSYENLKFPRIETALCGTSVIAPEIKLSVLMVNNVTINASRSSNAFGNLVVKDATDNLVFLFESLASFTERYYYNVKARNVFSPYVNNINFTALERFTSFWVEPNVFKTPIDTTNLIINSLQLPVQFYTELPRIVRNVVSKQDTYISNANNINLTDFLINAIKVEDVISLGSITFNSGFVANRIHANYTLPYLVSPEGNIDLSKKRISGDVKVDTIRLPYSFGIARNGTPLNIIVKGSVIFPTEPAIYKINEMKLEDELLMEIWLLTNATTFHGKNLNLRNALMEGNIALNDPTNALDLEIRRNSSERILSKTRMQRIKVDVYLNNVKTDSIAGANTSTIISSVTDLNDMFDNCLVKEDKVQNVTAKWTFDKLRISGKMDARKKINDIDFKTDVVKHDLKENIVTGKKTITVLTTKNFDGLNFSKWADGTLTREKEHAIVKGRKNFQTVTFNDVTLSGTVIERSVDKALLKSTSQTVQGQKLIRGSIHASSIFIDHLVNGINLTSLMDYQLKKQNLLQEIERETRLQKNLFIIGSLVVNDTYGNVNTGNFDTNYSNMLRINERMSKYSKIAEIINTVLRSRAIYVNKLEIVKDVADISHGNLIMQEDRCKIKNNTKYCVNEHVEKLMLEWNTKDLILMKTLILADDELVVWINFTSVLIYAYNDTSKTLVYLKGLHFPNIIDAYVEPDDICLWIVLRLTSDTLVLRYYGWKDFDEHSLPATDVFNLGRLPSGQLLLFLSHGVYNLRGLSSPRNVIETGLKGRAEIFTDKFNYFIRYASGNNTILTKARYLNN